MRHITVSEEKRCEGVMQNGQKCRGWKVKNSLFCHKHSLTPEQRVIEAKRGGISGTLMTDEGRIEIKNAKHIRKCLVNVLNGLREGKIERDVAGGMAYICNILINNFKLLEYEARLEEIENKLGIKEEVAAPGPGAPQELNQPQI